MEIKDIIRGKHSEKKLPWKRNGKNERSKKEKKRGTEEGSRQWKTMDRIFKAAVGIAVVACAAAAWMIVPEIHPMASTLIARSLTEQQYNNYISGKMDVKVDASVKAEDGTYAGMVIENHMDKVVLSGGKADITGAVDINYAGLAENKDRYRIYGDDSTQTMYLYFKDEDEIPVTGVTDKDYSKWYKMKQPEKESDKKNVPGILRKTLKDIEDKSFNKEKLSITGTITADRLAYILDYFEEFDPKNMNLLQGLEGETQFDITLQYTKKENRNILKKITLLAENTCAGDNVKIGNIEITMELDETAHGKEIHIPKGLDSGASGEDFVMPEPTPVESAQPEASLQSFMSLGLVLDGERMNDMTSVRSYISGNNRYSGWEVSTDGNLYKNSLITDENAQVYVYTNEADLVTQLEFDNTYAKKNSLNLLIGGLSLGCKKEELTGKFWVPEKTISTQESDELHYYIGDDHAQEIVLMFYKGDQTTNSGLQKITIFCNPGSIVGVEGETETGNGTEKQ